ncbi:nucleotidyl transferase AbiEii/AbiGii toxin family protein [Mucilaginibacter mali]|uniref:Nucleotidyl transferase AbiEii/AbiGii toxin family protein n=1 Tax=Mucilaginibacter mali TaxID=2740462 RepID=A0A7D4TMR0_9SPHI|nr:nucleotidyl transferase AbiEii/AbiGii toxin family protein [Mucilaginibacter mali]QKJ29354.1 nucleotidyl transferase AbiEii/AbiGii toxin family protein [Mucilaginibacter mali]
MLREETVEPATLGLLKQIISLPEMKDFRLVGGTAISLLYGHRKSIDLDLFTDKQIERDIVVSTLENIFGDIKSRDITRNIIQCNIQNVKVDLVAIRDPFIYPVQILDGIPFPDTRELIALKLNAIKGRGRKKDFWDIAKLLEFYSFDNLFEFYHDRYTYDDTFAVIRSMAYFNDAEDDIDPDTLDKITWVDVKKTISKGLEVYYKRKI